MLRRVKDIAILYVSYDSIGDPNHERTRAVILIAAIVYMNKSSQWLPDADYRAEMTTVKP
ncbi:MAG: hypothetical protein Fur005_14730 [Roseiflexaceae bacterium]